MSISYREGTGSDAEEVAALFRWSFTDTFGHLYAVEDLQTFLAGMDSARFRQELADERFAFILGFDDEKLAGYVKLGPPGLPVDTPPETIELCQLYIDRQWHGTGLAAGLMDRALERVRDQRARHVQLSVYVGNHRARRFYERYGFHAVGRYDFMVGSHADEDIVLRHIVMQADE